MLIGRMQDEPLLISTLLAYAAENHGSREITSKLPDGSIHRCVYRDIEQRAKKLAAALKTRGVVESDRIGTVAANSYRHLECFYAVSGMGAVLHTINPRLFDDQIEYIVNHAEDRILFVDLPYLALVERLHPKFKSVAAFVIMTDRERMPQTTLPNVICYEDLIEQDHAEFQWPRFDERAASSLCYTSGTTGNPKGILYSHRSTVLHAMHAAQLTVLGLGPADSILVIAPMYHANAWSVPYLAPMVGAKLVLPGDDMSAPSLHGLILDEGVTFACAVPTVWTTLLAHVDSQAKTSLGKLKRAAIAGVAVPPAMIDHLRTRYGVAVLQFWGMTEMSPIATISTPIPALDSLSEEERRVELSKQGRIAYGVRLKVIDESGAELARGGDAVGSIFGKGPWIANGYFKDEGGHVLDQDGWLPTGDVGFIDSYGYLKVTDRSKDVIKSGGEWISSVDLENAALSYPKIREAAVVGVFHPKWDERPILIVTLRDGQDLDREALIEHLRKRVAKWWLPDDVVVVKSLPYTATGKIKKLDLRQQYRFYLHADPSAVAAT